MLKLLLMLNNVNVKGMARISVQRFKSILRITSMNHTHLKQELWNGRNEFENKELLPPCLQSNIFFPF